MIYILHNRNPIYLDALLSEQYNPVNPFAGMNYEWNKIPKGEKQKFPDQLFLISRDKKWIDFDYHTQFNGFILSNEFLFFIRSHIELDAFQIVPVKVIDLSGNARSQIQYNYLYPYKRFNIINYDHSTYISKQGRERNESLPINGTWILKYVTLDIREDRFTKDIMVANDVLFGQYFFVKEVILQMIQNFKGFDAIRYQDFPAFYNKINHL